MLRVIAVLAAGLAVGGCQTAGGGNAPAQTLPPDYKAQIVAGAKEAFVDPYSIRDARIAAPKPGISFVGEIIHVCVRANAKNRMGGYTGQKDSVFNFRDGKLIQALDEKAAQYNCFNAVYEPFPELEAGGRPAVQVVPSSRPR